MRKFLKSKKGIALLATMIVAVAATVSAYAYFTDSGAGTGSATVGTSSTVSLAGTITGTLYPAGDPAGVSVLVQNTGSGSQYVDTITLASITTDAGHSACDLSVSGLNPAFTMADIAVATDLTKDNGAAGGTDQTTKTGSLQMNDTGVSQNACKNAPLTLHFTSN
jgi:hypothetical protein